jgi:DNA-binding transcriptional ArsR family regulator
MANKATVRDAILIALNDRSADNISNLARAINKARPSVSRALSQLRGAGLVEVYTRSIRLTPIGRLVAAKIDPPTCTLCGQTVPEVTRFKASRTETDGSVLLCSLCVGFALQYALYHHEGLIADARLKVLGKAAPASA